MLYPVTYEVSLNSETGKFECNFCGSQVAAPEFIYGKDKDTIRAEIALMAVWLEHDCAFRIAI